MLHDVAMAVADWFLTLQERENPRSRLAAPSAAPGWTTGNHVQALVHGRPYFEDLHQRIAQMDAGDRIYFTDWRGDPDEQLTDDGRTLSASLVAAAERGVDIRGLLWRSHWRYLGFHAEKHRQLARTSTRPVASAFGTCACATSGPTIRSSSSCDTGMTPPAMSPMSEASTSATHDAMTRGIPATRRPSRSQPPTAPPPPGTMCRPPCAAQSSTTWRRPSGSAGRTPPR